MRHPTIRTIECIAMPDSCELKHNDIGGICAYNVMDLDWDEHSSGDESYISQLTMDTNIINSCLNVSCVRQLSPVRTYDSDDDSITFDLEVKKISNEELSTDLDNVILRDLSSPYYDLDNFPMIKESEFSTNQSLRSNDKSIQTKVPSLSQCSYRSQRIRHLKDKLRQIEMKYQGCSSTNTSHSTFSHSITDGIESSTNTQNHHIRKTPLANKKTVEVAGEIICTGLAAGFFYLSSILYSDALSAILQAQSCA